MTALLTAASATGAVSTLGAISGYLQQLDGDPVATLEVAVLRAAADVRAEPDPLADPSPGTAELRELAADCAARLRGQLDRPRREPGDWSVTLPAGGCTCDLCATLLGFLAAPDRRTLEWPLAKQRRQHIHTRIDTAEVPVTHVTKRQGSPYVLVLRKTDDLFTGEQKARDQADSDLMWLASDAANWGTRELAFRLPRTLLDAESARQCSAGTLGPCWTWTTSIWETSRTRWPTSSAAMSISC